MVLALEKKWIWDSWYVHDGIQRHCFFLQADKSLIDPDLRHFNVSQGHAVGTDLVQWQHLGTMFAPSVSPAWDDYTTWTGSVLRGGDGLWHLFYTGSCRAENGMKQRLDHATSKDLHDWQRVGNGLCLDIDRRYEEYTPDQWRDRACRDPWVMNDPSGDGWLMYFTARVPGRQEPNAGGAIGFATSPDLYAWTLQDPVYAGATFGQMEVPQVFEWRGHWYCLFCTSAEHWSKSSAKTGRPVTGTHYMIAENPRGPWRVASGFLDGDLPCRRYAARVVEDSGKLWLLGFMHNPDGSPFVGEIADPQEVIANPDGQLRLGKIRSGKDQSWPM